MRAREIPRNGESIIPKRASLARMKSSPHIGWEGEVQDMEGKRSLVSLQGPRPTGYKHTTGSVPCWLGACCGIASAVSGLSLLTFGGGNK